MGPLQNRSITAGSMNALANVGDPAAVVKGIADKMQADIKASGMDAADAFVAKLNELKEKAKEGAGDLMDKVKHILESFKKTLEDALKDPGSLAPAGLAACASWYGKAVVEKLKSLATEFQSIFEAMMNVAKDMAGPFKELGSTMQDAISGISSAVKGLTAVPKQVQELVDKVKGPDDLKDVDTGGMKKNLDTSAMDSPLTSLNGIKDKLGPMADGAKGGIEKIKGFVSEAPALIRDAFSVPSPLTCLTSCAMSQAPPIMKELLDKVEAISKFNFQPIIDMLQSMAENVGKLDTAKVSEPVKKFSKMAMEQVEKLDKAVQGAKLMGGGLPGGLPGGAMAPADMKKTFGCLPKLG